LNMTIGSSSGSLDYLALPHVVPFAELASAGHCRCSGLTANAMA